MLGQRPLAKDGAVEVPVRIQFGGPVRTTRWTYIHSGDYRGPNTTTVTGKVSLTSSLGILSDLATGKGPAQGFLAIGYAGWGPGQLAREMARKDWFAIPPDSAIVLDRQFATKWRRALDRRSVDL
jgi:putative transcriptional regulator